VVKILGVRVSLRDMWYPHICNIRVDTGSFLSWVRPWGQWRLTRWALGEADRWWWAAERGASLTFFFFYISPAFLRWLPLQVESIHRARTDGPGGLSRLGPWSCLIYAAIKLIRLSHLHGADETDSRTSVAACTLNSKSIATTVECRTPTSLT
jgi:hypothetical protein